MYRVGFAGSGTVARAHAYAIATLPYYYPNLPAVLPTVVASRTREQAREFAQQFRFGEGMAIESLWKRDDVDTIFILGPNHLHHEHFQRTLDCLP